MFPGLVVSIIRDYCWEVKKIYSARGILGFAERKGEVIWRQEYEQKLLRAVRIQDDHITAEFRNNYSIDVGILSSGVALQHRSSKTGIEEGEYLLYKDGGRVRVRREVKNNDDILNQEAKNAKDQLKALQSDRYIQYSVKSLEDAWLALYVLGVDNKIYSFRASEARLSPEALDCILRRGSNFIELFLEVDDGFAATNIALSNDMSWLLVCCTRRRLERVYLYRLFMNSAPVLVGHIDCKGLTAIWSSDSRSFILSKIVTGHASVYKLSNAFEFHNSS